MALVTGDKLATITNLSPLLKQIKQDIEAASASGGGSSSSEDLDLIKARLTRIEQVMNDMHVNPFGEYEYMDEIVQTVLGSELDMTGTNFFAEFEADLTHWEENMTAELYEVYIIRNAADPIGYSRFKTLLPWEGAVKKAQYGSELKKVCKYNDLSAWNWNFDCDKKILLSEATESQYVFKILKRPESSTSSTS